MSFTESLSCHGRFLQNTLHYHKVRNFDNSGFKGDTLPQTGVDIDPVCCMYIANIPGLVALGYEEGNGDSLIPCLGGSDYSEEQIINASEDELKSMCAALYQTVCTRQSSKYQKACGGAREGRVDVKRENVSGLQQVRQQTNLTSC